MMDAIEFELEGETRQPYRRSGPEMMDAIEFEFEGETRHGWLFYFYYPYPGLK